MNYVCPQCKRTIENPAECPACGYNQRGNKSVKTFAIIGIILLILAAGSYGMIKLLEKPVGILVEQILQAGNAPYEISKASQNLPISKEPDNGLSIKQIIELRKLLQDREFEALTIALEDYQNSVETDYSTEYKAVDAYRAFDLTLPRYEALIEEWIKEFPNRHPPHFAMAQYYCAKGWESRGYNWAKDTTEEQLQNMALYFEKAEQKIYESLYFCPRLLPAYSMLIRIKNANDQDEEEDNLIKKALVLFPNSFQIRFDYIWAKLPRWGGSYAIMEDFAKEAETYSVTNPKLTSLYGFVYYDQARRLRRREKYQEAIDMLNKAFSYGDHWKFYYERASIFRDCFEDYDKALEDINRSIGLSPAKSDSFLMRAKIHFSSGNIRKSIKDLRTAERIHPKDSSILKWRDWAGNNLQNKAGKLYKTDLKAAVKKYSDSIAFSDNNPETFYWRGRAYYELKNFYSALNDFKKAIKTNPRHFESYRMIDHILMRDKKWDDIIRYWNGFLALEPDHAQAYLERAGTYHHKQDHSKALKDLKKSCDLGNAEACQRYNAVK